MFNLPYGDSPELLLGEFNFDKYYYEVCFETVEERYGLFKNRTRESKRYYITENRKIDSLGKRVRFLRVYIYGKWSNNSYWFMEAEDTRSAEVVYWDNPKDPINLLTFLKGRLDKDSHKDFVVFSSKDLE